MSAIGSKRETNDVVTSSGPNEMSRDIPAKWLTPANVLLLSSLPLGIGSYIGYRRALSSSVTESFHLSSSNRASTIGPTHSIIDQVTHFDHSSIRSKANIPPPPILAARALALGSLLSLSATSFLVSSVFFLSGCHSVEELLCTWRLWAPQKLRQMGNALGIPEEKMSGTQEYEIAVKGMTEDEEWEYVKQRYGHEIDWDRKDEK